MDKENFILEPIRDPLKTVSLMNEMFDKASKLAEEREKERILIEQFRKYKERNKAE